MFFLTLSGVGAVRGIVEALRCSLAEYSKNLVLKLQLGEVRRSRKIQFSRAASLGVPGSLAIFPQSREHFHFKRDQILDECKRMSLFTAI
jgi:hypothetical protein